MNSRTDSSNQTEPKPSPESLIHQIKEFLFNSDSGFTFESSSVAKWTEKNGQLKRKNTFGRNCQKGQPGTVTRNEVKTKADS